MGRRLVGGRQVRLSADLDTAVAVGPRYGPHVVLIVDSGATHAAGHCFYRSVNGVWLTVHVPARYLSPVDYPQATTAGW